MHYASYRLCTTIGCGSYSFSPWLTLIPAAILVAAACGGGGSEPRPTKPGAITVVVQTTGADPDPDGYQLRLDGGTPALLQPSDTVLLSDVATGPHTLLLSGAAANCSVAESNPASVQVSEGATASWTYHVACAPIPPVPGSARIIVQSTGVDIDPDGYAYSLDGAAPTPIAATQTALVPNLTPGPHSLALSGIAANCTLLQPSPQVHNVTSGTITDFPFDVPCARRMDQILFTNGSAGVSIITSDGSGSRLLVPMPFYVESPTWRPDHLRLAFGVSAPIGTLYTASYLTSDTLGFVVAPGLPVTAPSYSPDGNSLAFVVDYCGVIWTMSANGSEAVPVSTSSHCLLDPAWSPDGTRIAYAESDAPNSATIAVMGTDGSNPQPLTAAGADDRGPAWSPDGLRLAFSSNRSGTYRIYLMKADGSDVHPITDSTSYDDQPSWSPDGTRVVFRSLRLGFPHLFTVDSTGANLLPLTGTSGTAENYPAWHR